MNTSTHHSTHDFLPRMNPEHKEEDSIAEEHQSAKGCKQIAKASKWKLVRAKRTAAKFLMSTKAPVPARQIEALLLKGSSKPLKLDATFGHLPIWSTLSGMLHQTCMWKMEGENLASTSPNQGCGALNVSRGIQVFSGMRFRTCAASGVFGAAASMDGNLYTWGNIFEEYQQLWSPPVDPNIPVNRYDVKYQHSTDADTLKDAAANDALGMDLNGLVQLSGQYPVRLLACGCNHIVGLLENVGAIAWGDNKYGQLGIPGMSNDYCASRL